MKLLLDTHVLLWWLSETPFDQIATHAISDSKNEVYVSAVTAWEVSIKVAKGNLRINGELSEGIAESGFEILPIRWSDAVQAGGLAPHHRDPFDRLLIAQAQVEDLTLITRDREMRRYDVSLLSA
jgi:PIN domain nuclease of toxin-antitoxin system